MQTLFDVIAWRCGGVGSNMGCWGVKAGTDSSFEDSSFLDPLAISQAVDTQEVLNLLRTRRTNKAPGSDSIPNDFLKAMGEPLAAAVAAIATACWKLGYYPKQFKHACTVVIRKPGKAVYNTPGV